MTTIFKKIIDKEIPAKIIYEDNDFIAFLDISQSTPGHTLIIPKEETVSALSASADLVAKINVKAVEIAKMMMPMLKCEGFNFISNSGKIAGQTVDHYHVHIVPRYHEDELKYVFKSNDIDIENIYNKFTK